MHLRRISIGLIVTAIAVVALPSVTANASPNSDLVSMMNSLRATHGVAPLSVDNALTANGGVWASNLARTGSLSHQSPSALPNGGTRGENVGTGSSAASIFQAFVNSPEHYANMVNPAFHAVGVGFATASNGALYTSDEFGQSDGGSSVPTAAPTKASVASSINRSEPVRASRSASVSSKASPSTTSAPPTTEAPVTAPPPTVADPAAMDALMGGTKDVCLAVSALPPHPEPTSMLADAS